MILEDNLTILKQRFPFLYEQMKDHRHSGSEKKVEIVTAKSGIPTLCCMAANAQVFIHSKYDPIDEASKLLGKYADISRYKHVFFFGIGLGYHIEAFIGKYPAISVSLYEPDREILSGFLAVKPLKQLLKGRVENIYAGHKLDEIQAAVSHFAGMINGEVLFIVLPSYERIFGNEYKAFQEALSMAVKNKKASLQARVCLQKLWTRNSIRNFGEVIDSPNILHDKRKYFDGKPAIIAAAGPSLEDELENLRFIKNNGFAYIFSVGSAINTLVANGIYPDAVCIYDPAENTGEVVRKVKELRLDIPLIFGSSVYPEAIRDYPGSRLHILNSQDTISTYFLKFRDGGKLQQIIDAPSVAIVTLQMLIRLGCTPIILVGQNFAFRNNRYYARGIRYKYRQGELNSTDETYAVEVEDVHGGKVRTNRLFTHMRSQMEMYIDFCGCKDIINATKGGAKIKGTVYKPMEELLEKELVGNTVSVNWAEADELSYDISYMVSRTELLLEERKTAKELIETLIGSMEELRVENSTILLQKALNDFEGAYNKLVSNRFFDHVLRPMNRVQFEMILKNIADISVIKDIPGKARFIAEIFDDVFECCLKDMTSIEYDFEDTLEEIMENDIKVMVFTIKSS